MQHISLLDELKCICKKLQTNCSSNFESEEILSVIAGMPQRNLSFPNVKISFPNFRIFLISLVPNIAPSKYFFRYHIFQISNVIRTSFCSE